MKKLLTMTFIFTLASATGVLGANNNQTCNNNINDCSNVKFINCNDLTNLNNFNLKDNCIAIISSCGINSNCNTCINSELPNLKDDNTDSSIPVIEENENNTDSSTPVIEENENNTDSSTPVIEETEDNTQMYSLLAIEKEVVELVNQERAKYGLSPLEIDTEVSYVARLKAEDMANSNYFSHNSPTYGSPFNMLLEFNINYKSAGENIAMGQKTAADVVNAWMNSEGHRANILNSSYTHIGVGYALNGNTPYWSQMFISK